MSTPETSKVELIHSEAVELLRDSGANRLHPDSKILLAAMLFADEEGVAYINDGALAHWCKMPGRKRGSDQHVQQRIEHLVDAGVLAPGSTTTELRSMIGRAAEQKPKRARGQRGRRGVKSAATETEAAA